MQNTTRPPLSRAESGATIVSIPLGSDGIGDSPDITILDSDEWTWQHDSATEHCSNPDCRQPFWLFRRRHHCRPCGKVFCGSCCFRSPSGSRQCMQCRRLFDPGSEDFRSSLLVRHTESRSKLIERIPRCASTGEVPELRRVLSFGPPQKVFQMGKRIAQGAFGAVYHARDHRVGDMVAIKVIRIRPEVDEGVQRARVASEVACHHAALEECKEDEQCFPQLYSAFESERRDAIWLVMELIDGETLVEYLRVEFPMPASKPNTTVLMKIDANTSVAAPAAPSEEESRRMAASIQTLDLTKMDAAAAGASSGISRGIADERTLSHFTNQLVTAVQRIHSANIIFRDLKPDNIMVVADAFSERKTLRIIDFGSAILLPEGVTEAQEERLIGSPAYMAPESWGHIYSFATDIWSIGCVVYEMATGISPYKCIADKVAALAAHLPPEGLPERRAAVEVLRERMRDMHTHCRAYLQKKGPQPRGVDSAWATLCWSEEVVDFVGRCLDPEPSKRWTCAELLRHPFLTRHVTGSSRSLNEVDCEIAYARLRSSRKFEDDSTDYHISRSMIELRPGVI